MAFSAFDEHCMQRALALAKLAETRDEVPVGAVVALRGKIIAEGFNQPISCTDPTAHAEVIALRQAATALDNYRLVDCELYCTLEPCLMCVGAMIHARINRCVYAASDPKTGACGSVVQLAEQNLLNHQVSCEAGLFAEEAGGLLKQFFLRRRG